MKNFKLKFHFELLILSLILGFISSSIPDSQIGSSVVIPAMSGFLLDQVPADYYVNYSLNSTEKINIFALGDLSFQKYDSGQPDYLIMNEFSHFGITKVNIKELLLNKDIYYIAYNYQTEGETTISYIFNKRSAIKEKDVSYTGWIITGTIISIIVALICIVIVLSIIIITSVIIIRIARKKWYKLYPDGYTQIGNSNSMNSKRQPL